MLSDKNKGMMKKLFFWALCSMLFATPLSAQDGLKIIEHGGDRFVIHVDAMKPDKEMTLMDVLLTCPELMSNNGKRLSTDYELRMDNVVLVMDDETILEALKAHEISTIEVYLYTSVSTGGGGRLGTIDIYLKEQADGKTSGKLWLEGSTRGNGKAYADVITLSGNVTVRGHALANLEYAKGTMTDYDWFSSRQGIENVHLNIDWNISENDNLKFKLTQNFSDSKHRILMEEGGLMAIPELQRYWGGVASYTRTLNEKGATLLTEGGVEYLNSSIEEVKFRDFFAYYFAETSIPFLNNDLTLLAGWEIDYDNSWTVGYDRQHTLFNDLYLQFDYAKGPWVLTLGDRFRIINYWHHIYAANDASRWNNNRTTHSFLASAGYKTGGHFVQGMFSRDYFTPVIDNFIGYDEDIHHRKYKIGRPANMVHSVEARYTYQQADLVVNGSVQHSWENDNPLADEHYTGVRASATWRKGVFRLTAGADFYHGHVKSSDFEIDRHDNFFHIRLLPTLLLGNGLRISSKLLFNSQMHLLYESPAHLYASVKVSKSLGRRCTLSADFHDLAGSPQIPLLQLGRSYDDRALTLGFTYRF